MSRYAILRHETPPGSPRASHWDLLVERGGVLRSWACEDLPAPGREVRAEALADHRLVYLEYEGPLSDNRGSVSRWDQGRCRWITAEEDLVVLEVRGTKLTGRIVLRRTGDPQSWRLTFVTA